MPELRKDPITGRWVIIAPDRAKRPTDFQSTPNASAEEFCPFCEGNESACPNEIRTYRHHGSVPNERGWRVRCVPNKFPALTIEGQLESRGDGMYDVIQGVGAHEVIIDCPQHETRFSNLPAANIREVLWMYHDRLVDLKRDKRLVHPLVFKNEGAAAGASLEHSHSQLIVTPVVPIQVAEEMRGAKDFFGWRGRCIYCDMIRQELDDSHRIVLDAPNFVVFCPFASRFPFETWILPKRHSSHYETVQEADVDELSHVLKTTLQKLEVALDNPPYNYILHTAPFHADNFDLKSYHWHLEIIPRLTGVAGFEWGSGFYINSVPPEDAGAFLRQAEI